MVEFRDRGRGQSKPGTIPTHGTASTTSTSGVASGSNFSTCRFCLRQSSPEHPVMDSLCSDKECIDHSKTACTIVLSCGHFCGGIINETKCLPCLHGCSGGSGKIFLINFKSPWKRGKEYHLSPKIQAFFQFKNGVFSNFLFVHFWNAKKLCFWDVLFKMLKNGFFSEI